VVVVEGGLGTLRGNHICDNLGAGVLVGPDCRPVVEQNWIMRNRGVGLSIRDGRAGRILDNHLEDNYSGPLATVDPGLYEYYVTANAASA
jgi:hypothetical protein